jgi:hypothetical protein
VFQVHGQPSVCEARNFLVLVCSLSSHRHSYIDFIFTSRFIVFGTSGVHLPEHDRDQFHFRWTAFASHLRDRVDLTLAKTTSLHINLNIDGSPITSRTHTHPSHSQTSRLLTSSLSLGVPVPRHVDSSDLGFSLSSHRHSYIGLVFSSLFIDS